MATGKKKKKEVTKDELARFRKVQSMNSMYFNRFLMIRYFTAVFFFMSFYWLYLNFTNGHWMTVLSLALFVFSFSPTLELIRAFSDRHPSIKWTKLFYKIIPIVIPILMILLVLFEPTEIMPFLTGTMTSRIVMLCILGVLEAMAIACRIRIIQIESNTDKQYQRILQLSKYNKL